MFRKLIYTHEDFALAFLRLILGIVFFAHGAQKVLGWFGGSGYSQTMYMLTHHAGLPDALAGLVIWTEFAGGLGLIFGFLTRIAALGIGIEMVVAALMMNVQNGFFMNWYGNQRGEGFEYHLLVVALALILVAKGAGAFSVDHALLYPPRYPRPYPVT